MANGAKVERRGPGWIATLLGTAVLVVCGFALGLVAGVVSEEPGLVVDYVSGRTDRVTWSPDAESELTSPRGATSRAAAGAAEPRVPEGATAGSAARDPAPPAPRSRASSPQPKDLAARPEAQTRAPDVSTAPRVPQRSAISGYAVQVGAFAESGTAERVARELRGKGFPVYVTPSEAGEKGRWRVRVGPVKTEGEADRLAKRLQTEERLPTWVLEDESI